MAELESKKYKYDFSIIIFNNNSNKLIDCLKSINNQEYNLDKVQVIIETTKLEKEIIDIINNLNYQPIIRINDKLNLADCYNDALSIIEGKFITFINSSILYKGHKMLSRIYKKNKKILVGNIFYYDLEEKMTYEYLFNKIGNITIRLDKDAGLINICLESCFVKQEFIKGLSFDNHFGMEAKIKFFIELNLIEVNKHLCFKFFLF